MLHKTKGVVLNYLKYKESSIIAKVYTERFGIQSYVVNGVRSSKAKVNRIALFQPLTLLDMVVYHKSKLDTLHRLSEVRNLYPFSQLPFDIVKTSLALFITELLGKCLKEEEANPLLFEFLQRAVVELDETSEGLESFHLFFMCRLAGFLGFEVESMEHFTALLGEYRYSDLPDARLKESLFHLFAGDVDALRMAGKTSRARILAQLIFYYRTHMEGFGDIKSLDILKTVLR
jgi:DNA repair protein RecO (recombination protein O)